jgi:signal peptidase II
MYAAARPGLGGRTPEAGEVMQQARQMSWLWGPLSALGMGWAVLTLAVDQALKWWVLAVLDLRDRGPVRVTPFLDLVYVSNKGISYGLLPLDSPLGQVLLAGFAGLAVLAMGAWLARWVTTRLVAVSLGVIMGGAIGNAIDRLVLGGVADFIQVHAFGYYWYVFNIADAAIVAGVCGLLYDCFAVSRNSAANSP